MTTLPREHSAQAWLHVFDAEAGLTRDALRVALAGVGVSTSALEQDSSGGPGIVCFGQVTPQVCRFVHEFSRGGLERVLAVASSAATLNEGGAWKLLVAGASDVLAWDGLPDPAAVVAARLERWRAVDTLLDSWPVRKYLVGSSPAWISKLREILEAARFTDAAILLIGETGTGKELVARVIHELDARQNKRDFVISDCTTIVPELSGSEFFGHERGAFTGAVAPRDGAFALADGGTLFLDEVGELSPSLQAQLLRVVQEHAYKRVGSNTWYQTYFRLVCATNRNLLDEVTQGRFRRDLYYRIAHWVFTLPPLRQRPEDIIPLARHFMGDLRHAEEPPELDAAVKGYLLGRDYPGNVRDLKQLASRIMYRHVGPGPITLGDIPEDERRPAGSAQGDWQDAGFEVAVRRAVALGVRLKDIRHAAEETAIGIAVRAEQGNLQRAARRLGVTDRALQLRRAARRRHAAAANLTITERDEEPPHHSTSAS